MKQSVFNSAHRTFSKWEEYYLRPFDDSLDNSLCQYCRRIDMDKLLAFGLEEREYEKWDPSRDWEHWSCVRSINVDYIQSPNNCPACALFLRLGQAHQQTYLDKVPEYRLYAGLAFPHFRVKMTGLSLSQAASPVLWIEKFNHGARNDPHHYLLPSERVQDTFTGRPVGDTIEWKGIHEWLEFCDKTHGDKCHQPTTENNLRLSFIDCSSGIVIHNEPATSYVTLSYVWADADHDSSSPDYTLPQDLPRVIDDAITVTKNLGFRYLWVDRYCIPQNSNQTLKQEFIERMGDIYSLSSLTIIAAAKNALSRGLPGVRARCRDTISCIRLGGHEFAPIFTSHDKEILSSAWNKRGWTFQEERLSSRKIVFANSQIYFQCRKMHCFEALKAPLAVLHRQPERSWIRGYFAKDNAAMMFPRVFSINTNHNDDLWRSITAFNTRQLSFPMDAFDAFRGVLAQFSKESTPTLHLCGHPIRPAGSASDFLQSLIWTHPEASERRKGFPSWSWIGWRWTKEASPFLPSFKFYEPYALTGYDCTPEVIVKDIPSSLSLDTSREHIFKLANQKLPSDFRLKFNNALIFKAQAVCKIPSTEKRDWTWVGGGRWAPKDGPAWVLEPERSGEDADFVITAEPDRIYWDRDAHAHRVTGLVTVFSTYIQNKDFIHIEGLMLSEMEEASETVYERCGTFNFGLAVSSSAKIKKENDYPVGSLSATSLILKRQDIVLQ